ncbi:MAG: serine hydrolase [Rhodothermales bacterium]
MNRTTPSPVPHTRATPFLVVLCIPVLLMVGLSACTPAPDTARLERDLQDLAEAFNGDVGIHVRHLESGYEWGIRADTLFPTASLVKVPIMLGIFDRMEKGELDYTQEMVYRDSLFYSDEDLTGELRDSATTTLDQLVMLMISLSDNTASLWLQETAGTGTAINAWLAENGYAHTRVNSRTEGRRGDWERYGWGQTTPREMSDILVSIREGRAVSPSASEEMYRVLTRTYWNDEALSVLPPTVQVASKQGAVSASKSEVLLVNAPHGDFVLTIMTKNQEDRRWEADNAGYVLIRDVTRAVWNTFEPAY